MIKEIRFNQASIQSLPLQPFLYEVRDTVTPGLIIRVNPSGVKTFMFFRRIRGKLKRLKLGRSSDMTVDQARKAAITYNSELIAGVNPHESKVAERQELTFSELYERYYNEHALVNTKRPEESRATIKFHTLPKIGHLRLSEITRTVIKQIFIEQGLARGKQQANKVMNIVSATFNFGIREGYFTGVNPTLGIKRFKGESRDRFLRPHELGKFLQALKEEEQLYQDFFLLSLFIGARKSTMLAMRFSQIDFELGHWRLSASESKNNDVNIYCLSDQAIEILKRRLQAQKDLTPEIDYVFPGRGKKGHLVDPKRAYARIKERMEVKDLWIHDLRRTLGSYMAINNSSLPIIASALNHKSLASTQIYARLNTAPVSKAVSEATINMIRYMQD
ncbi:MAG: hypothetical protein BGO69_10665 [Bacteroidetes bacterium 46-16]|nr:MAG: hypothetical protein BGO69_10665 [Bacteroidetes bacterium 46-16]